MRVVLALVPGSDLDDATGSMDELPVDGRDTGHGALSDISLLSGVLSAREAAGALGVNARTIRRAIARGDLAAIKHGRAFRITPEALVQYQRRRSAPRSILATGISSRSRVSRGPAATPPLLRLVKRQRELAFELPHPLTSFLGREREIAAVVATLTRPEIRLLTLIGTGGSGKTRFALQVAEDLAPRLADGAAFVSLAAAGHAGSVPAVVARALGVRENHHLPIADRLATVLYDRRMLLVLDNFEHVLASAPLVTDLLTACPGLTILVTSRVTLRLSGEHTIPVSPLTLPDWETVTTAATASASEAVKLFVARATAAQAGFVLTDENAGVVAELCRRLDGLPLAIELAAARVSVLPPRAQLSRIDRPLPLLTGGPRDVPHRLKTMRGSIAWSYDLLSADEQRLLRWLAVFAGGFTVEAAAAVAGSGADVLEGVSSLVSSSLLRQENGPGGEPRFNMLEMVREFGLDRLEETGEQVNAQTAHAAHFVAFGEQHHPNRVGYLERVDARIERIEAEDGNFRAAFTSMVARDDTVGVLRLAGALAVFWHLRGHLREGRGWLEWALAHTEQTPTAQRGRALAGLGLILWAQGFYEQATTAADAGLTIAEHIKDKELAANSLHVLGLIAFVQSQLDRAGPILEQARSLWRKLGAHSEEGWALDALGRVADSLGNSELATGYAEESLAIFRTVGHASGAATALDRLAKLARDRGDDRRAALARLESLRLWSDIGDRWPIVQALAGLSEIASAHDQPQAAAALIGAIDTLEQEAGAPIFPSARVNYERAAAVARTALGGEQFEALRAAGRKQRLEDAVAVAAAVAAPAALGGVAGHLLSSANVGVLTAREKDVLCLVAGGRTDREIADTLFLSRRTVNAHVARILAKFEVRTRREAALRGRELGLLAAGDEPYRYT